MSQVDFLILTMASLCCAFFFKRWSSRAGYESWRYYFCGVFNLVFICTYMRVVDQGCIVLVECLGKKHQDYPLMAAMALVAAVLHALAMPSRTDEAK